MDVSHAVQEVEQWSGVAGYPKVRPGQVVELVYLPHLIRALLKAEWHVDNYRAAHA